MSGPAAWKLVLRNHADDPQTAMRLLRLAGCSPRRRALLAVETWCEESPELTALALLSIRSVPALTAALRRTGWDDQTPDPDGVISKLFFRARFAPTAGLNLHGS